MIFLNKLICIGTSCNLSGNKIRDFRSPDDIAIVSSQEFSAFPAFFIRGYCNCIRNSYLQRMKIICHDKCILISCCPCKCIAQKRSHHKYAAVRYQAASRIHITQNDQAVFRTKRLT